MSLLFAEGFEYGLDAISEFYPDNWVTVALGSDLIFTQTGNSGQALRYYGTSAGGFDRRFDLTTTANTVIAGRGWNAPSAVSPSADRKILYFTDNSTTKRIWVTVNDIGGSSFRFAVYGFDGVSTSLLSVGSLPVFAASWYYVELKANYGPSGSYELRINGVLETSGSLVTGSQVPFKGVGFSRFATSASSSYYDYIDDMYICDDAGSSFNNISGPIRITCPGTVTTTTTQNGGSVSVSLTRQGFSNVVTGIDERGSITVGDTISSNVLGAEQGMKINSQSHGTFTAYRISARAKTNIYGSYHMAVLEEFSSNIRSTPVTLLNNNYRWLRTGFNETMPGGSPVNEANVEATEYFVRIVDKNYTP